MTRVGQYVAELAICKLAIAIIYASIIVAQSCAQSIIAIVVDPPTHPF